MSAIGHYGIFLSNLRSNAGLSLELLARCTDSSKSALSRLENGEVPQPFKGTTRTLVINLAELLCTSRKETERYLRLASINVELLTEMEELQLGFVPYLDGRSSEDQAALQRRERLYQQLIQQLQAHEALFTDGDAPLRLKTKLQEYNHNMKAVQNKLSRLDNQDTSIRAQPVHADIATEDEGRIVVGTMYGKDIDTSNSSHDLYTLASPHALSLMHQAGTDCFAVDDLITLTQSHAFAGWNRDDIFITRLPTPLPIPADIEAIWREKLPPIQKKFVNSSHYRLASFTPAFSDRRGLEVTLAPIGFHDFYTLMPVLDEPLLTSANGEKVSIREHYGATALTYSTTGETCLIPAPVSLQCVLITKDEEIVLMQRSNSVAFYPSHWSASFEETMDSSGLSPKGNIRTGDSDFFECATRGLGEEFGIPADAIESIKILSLNVEYLILAVGMVAIIRTHLTSQEVKNHWLVQAPDRNEAAKLATLPANLASVVEKLFSSNVLWHPTSRMRLVQFLFHTYGVNEVAKAIKAR